MTLKMPSVSMRRFLEEACQRYQESLKDSVASRYLTNRGITSEVQTYFRLGFVEEPAKGHEFMVGRLAIPYITPTGIIQMRFRSVPENGEIDGPAEFPKYKSETGGMVTIYNVIDLHNSDTVIAVCEGEIDTMSAHAAGIKAVGIPGAKNWTKEATVFARMFRYRKPIILADNDDSGAGLKFAKEVQSSLNGSRIVLMDKGYDVNKYLMEFGPEALREKCGV